MRPRHGNNRGSRWSFSPGERPERPGDPAIRRANLRRVAGLFKAYRSRLAAVLGLIFFSALLSIVSPFLVRDIFDRTGMGVILIGMPGMEKRLSRYRSSTAASASPTTTRPLQGDEPTFVLTRHWRRLGLALDDADFTDAQALASIARITGGNFRLLHRLFVQIGRILKINGLLVVTDVPVHGCETPICAHAAIGAWSSWSARTWAGVLYPCRSMIQVRL